MYINFWYPAGLATEITGRAVRRCRLAQGFVLWCDQAGQVRCLANTCIHWGASLADGKVVRDEVRCPYHGWRFAGEGRCAAIPSLGRGARIPDGARVDGHPVVEKHDLVFIVLSDLPEGERCPILDIPECRGEAPDHGWCATVQHFTWNIDYQRSIETGLAGARNGFVHPTHGHSGDREDIRIAIEDYEIVDTEWDSGHFSSRRAPPLADPKMREASGRTVDAVIRGGTGHHGAAMVWTLIHPTERISIHQHLFETPIAFAIPSPARRQQAGWVLDPIPLMPARTAAVAAAMP
jgi:phenylpropionate dioxygenase-like ring-hydroxylating dioxygenase large terminal subunit